VATILSVMVLLFGATGMMAQLQSSLNYVWGVEPDPQQGGIKNFLLKRVFSMAMILVVAALLLASLLLSTVLHAFGEHIAAWLPSGSSQTLLNVLNFIVSFLVITVLFAAMFKVLPDVKIAWCDVWVGAVVTALLFVIGKTVISIYLGSENLQATYGSAGSLVLLLIWVYYSSMILLFGAEFARVWATRSGQEVQPSRGAIRVERKRQVNRPQEGHERA
jgi:membrane protein